MMNRLSLVLASTVFITACANYKSSSLENCERLEIPACTGNPDKPKITINTQSSGQPVAPPNVCANPGTQIEVKVVPPSSTVTVAVVPKDPSNTWLRGINSPDPGGFTIDVPEDLGTGDYDYLVVTGSGRCIDPRIRVD